MQEERARRAITRWARHYYRNHYEDPFPVVNIVTLSYNQESDEYTAELSVSTVERNPVVTFWFDPHHVLEDNQLHVDAIA